MELLINVFRMSMCTDFDERPSSSQLLECSKNLQIDRKIIAEQFNNESIMCDIRGRKYFGQILDHLNLS